MNSSPVSLPIPTNSARPRGALLMVVFAFVGAMSASSALADTMSMLLALGGSMLATLVVVAFTTRAGFSGSHEPSEQGWQRAWFFLIGALQVVAVAAAAATLNALGRPELLPGAVSTAVGLLLLPLTAVFRRGLYLWTGLLLCVIGGTGLVLALTGNAEPAQIAVGFAAAAVLWLAALLLALTGGADAAAAPGSDTAPPAASG